MHRIDEQPNVAVEVWGVKGRELYDLRHQAKIDLYERGHLRLLQWDVADPPPDVGLRGRGGSTSTPPARPGRC